LAKNFKVALKKKDGEGDKTEFELENFFLDEIYKQPEGGSKWD